MNKKVAIILVNYKNYAERFFDDCITSINKQDYQGELKVFIVDNETSQETFSLISQKAPSAELILNKDNEGFAKGNNDAIKLAMSQGFDYIVLFNMDTLIDSSCVSKMVKDAEKENNTGAVQARLMLHPETNKINSLGNTTHFLGFGYCLAYGESMKDKGFSVKDIAYPSGAAVLFKRGVLEKIGLFDEEFWMYNEDQDLGWRVWLAGYKCVLSSSAIVYHKYEFCRSISKYYWMDRNRIIAILKNYHILTLILIFPAFIIMEFGLILFSLKSGWFKDKLKVWLYFLTPKTWFYLVRARKESQEIRKVKDKDIVKLFTGEIWYQEVGDWKLKVINPIFSFYWKVINKIIIW